MKQTGITGIIGAMDKEVNDLKQSMRITETVRIAGMEFCLGTMNDKEIAVVQCGIGKVNAGVCAQLLITRFGVDKIINTGVAGSLNNAINIGDVVISTDAVQHDYDVSPIGFAKGEIPYTGLYAFEADEHLRKAAIEAVKAVSPGTGIFEGRVCSGDQFIASGKQKKRIVEEFGGECAEMEGAAIAQVCHLNQIPFVIIRSISDKADDSEEISYEIFAEQAAKVSAAAVRCMVENQ